MKVTNVGVRTFHDNRCRRGILVADARKIWCRRFRQAFPVPTARIHLRPLKGAIEHNGGTKKNSKRDVLHFEDCDQCGTVRKLKIARAIVGKSEQSWTQTDTAGHKPEKMTKSRTAL